MPSNPDTVTDALRSDILAGGFPPGERLVELQLTDRYECGRAAVRAAFVALEGEGLVEREANRGAAVRRISVGEVIQITEARAALESLIAANAAANASDSDRAELTSVIDQMEAAVDAGDAETYSDLNKTFHARIRDISGHAVASELVSKLRNRATHHQYRLALMPGRPAISLGQHRAIAEAIATGDEQAAAAAMETHLNSVIEVLRQWGDASPV